jgi:integrase/recombinase XerD
MGFKVAEVRTLLPQFSDVLDQPGHTCITTDWAGRWATPPRSGQPAQWARRLGCVRGFARSPSALDARTELPPTGLLPYRPQRRSPYLYSAAEMTQRLEAAGRLPAATGRRAHTYTTVFGLRVVTGLRISDLVGLDNDDSDLTDG